MPRFPPSESEIRLNGPPVSDRSSSVRIRDDSRSPLRELEQGRGTLLDIVTVLSFPSAEGRGKGRTDLGPVRVALDVRIEVVGECDPATLHLGRRFRRVHTKDIEQITRVEGLSPSAPAKDRGEGTYAKDRKVLVHAGDVAPNRHLFPCHLEERPSTRLEERVPNDRVDALILRREDVEIPACVTVSSVLEREGGTYCRRESLGSDRPGRGRGSSSAGGSSC